MGAELILGLSFVDEVWSCGNFGDGREGEVCVGKWRAWAAERVWNRDREGGRKDRVGTLEGRRLVGIRLVADREFVNANSGRNLVSSGI